MVAKPCKIRICLDTQELNKVILRPNYQMSTLEEKIKIFGTLDAKEASYQISLIEASSRLTFGRLLAVTVICVCSLV